MRSVTYSMSVSPDGYIVGPDGGFDWTAPDEEVFRLWIDEMFDLGSLGNRGRRANPFEACPQRAATFSVYLVPL